MPNAFTVLDGKILMAIQHACVKDWLTPIMRFITMLGNAGTIWILLVVALIICKKTRKIGIIAGIALALSFCVNNLVLKNLIGRTRPYEMFDGVTRLIAKPHDKSFPSGHAASSFVVAVSVALYVPKKYGIPLIALACLIAFSRLYLGVHYPSDVIAGALSGTLIAYILYKVDKKKNGEWLTNG